MTVIVVALYFCNRISGASSAGDKILYVYVRMFLSCGNIEIDISDINRTYIYIYIYIYIYLFIYLFSIDY